MYFCKFTASSWAWPSPSEGSWNELQGHRPAQGQQDWLITAVRIHKELLFWCHRLQQYLLIHIKLKMFIITFSHIIWIRQEHQVNLYHSYKILLIFLFSCLLPLPWLSEALASITYNLWKISLQAWRSLWIWILKAQVENIQQFMSWSLQNIPLQQKRAVGKRSPE